MWRKNNSSWRIINSKAGLVAWKEYGETGKWGERGRCCSRETTFAFVTYRVARKISFVKGRGEEMIRIIAR